MEVEVETDTEDEELVEREVEKRVIKEFKVPQVVAKHDYDGEGLSMKKGEVIIINLFNLILSLWILFYRQKLSVNRSGLYGKSGPRFC